MASLVLQLKGPDPAIYTVTLDGNSYEIRQVFNRRDEAWYLDISKPQGDTIVYGLKCVSDRVLLSRVLDEDAPPGTLACFDPTGLDRDPDEDTLGNEVFIGYVEEE